MMRSVNRPTNAAPPRAKVIVNGLPRLLVLVPLSALLLAEDEAILQSNSTFWIFNVLIS